MATPDFSARNTSLAERDWAEPQSEGRVQLGIVASDWVTSLLFIAMLNNVRLQGRSVSSYPPSLFYLKWCELWILVHWRTLWCNTHCWIRVLPCHLWLVDISYSCGHPMLTISFTPSWAFDSAIVNLSRRFCPTADAGHAPIQTVTMSTKSLHSILWMDGINCTLRRKNDPPCRYSVFREEEQRMSGTNELWTW